MAISYRPITGTQLCLISGLLKEKTAASQSLDCKALLWLAKPWEIKETIGQQMLSSLLKIEWVLSSSALQQRRKHTVTVLENYIKAVMYNEDVCLQLEMCI